MKNVLPERSFPIIAVVLVGLFMAVSAFVLAPRSLSQSTTPPDVAAEAQPDQPDGISVNVTQHHNHDSRDGLFVDPAFTLANAANLTRDLGFSGVISGNVYGQPLYVENGPGGAAMVIVGTESNNIYALNATTGSVIWQRNLGTPGTGLPCGNVIPEGIHGTPVVDVSTRSLYLNALTMPSAGVFRQMIYSLNVDSGATNIGWPVSVEGLVSGTAAFTSQVQGERGALAIVGDRVYVPYGGRAGDCGTYHGWIVGVKMSNPNDIMGWSTRATGGTAWGGGAWSVGGISSDGTTPFLATGNTFSTGGTWRGGEAIIRLQPGPIFTGSPTDYWAPTNWLPLDNSDTDLGGTGAMLVDVPGATPSQLVVALGKDRNAYLLNRGNLGGIAAPIAQANGIAGSPIIQAAATYRTSLGTYVVFRGSSTMVGTFRITPSSPPMINTTWGVSQSGRGSPWVTTTDGTNNAIVWVVGSEGSERLMGYNGDTGAVVYGGGGANELMTGTHRFNTGIAARGRIYFAADNRVYAFRVPAGVTPTPTATATNTPTATATTTPTMTPMISGNVDYAVVSKPVPNTVITAAGSPPLNTTTNSLGNYALSGFGPGAYTVTPSRTAQPCAGSPNGIFANDAALIAQHVVGINTLSPDQQVAAKVETQVPGITSLDASFVAQKTVGICDVNNLSGQWKFSPPNIAHPSGVTGQLIENYRAYLLGDVSGDWNPLGAGPESPWPIFTLPAIASLPDISAGTGTSVTLPLRLDDLQGADVNSYQFDITYDPSVISQTDLAVTTSGTMSEGLNVVYNAIMPGLLRVTVYGPIPVMGDGVYLDLHFRVGGDIGASTSVVIDGFRLGDGSSSVKTKNGLVRISAADDTADESR
jgi:hypothetical protein